MAEAPVPRLPARSSRGNRMTAVMLEEDKGEDEFWSQHKDMFADEAGDNEFSEEGEEEDVVDADFDAPEDQPAPESEAQEAEKEAKTAEKPEKKKKGYVDPKRHPQHPKRQRKEKVHIGEEPREAAPRKPVATSGTTDESVATHLRASTKKLTKQKHAERQRQEEEYEIRRATRPRRSGGEGPRMSQEQLLAEAVRTEETNRASLEILLRIEEERKRVGPAVPAITGPMIRFKSTADSTTVSFMDFDLPSPPFGLSAPAPPTPRVCAVTGLPARYIDPKTNSPYATVAAFKALREKAAAVKVQALSALLEEKRRKREEAKIAPCETEQEKETSATQLVPAALPASAPAVAIPALAAAAEVTPTATAKEEIVAK